MKSHELTTNSNQPAKRSGRGIAAGRGKTAGRGTKGQNSRAGGNRRPGFEGGQNPMFQRIPKKRGFRGYALPTTTITTAQLNALATKVTNQTLLEAGLIDDLYVDVKLISKGEVEKKHTVELRAATAGARKMIEKAGGTFTEAPHAQRAKSKTA